MNCKIRQIVLWPKDDSKMPRVIELSLNEINILSGESQTGKSALISIIDYALGSGKCTIPVGLIREKTSWFGVVLQLDQTQVLLARREPGAQAQTSDMFLAEAREVNIPSVIEKNASIDAAKARLNLAAGLSPLDFAGGEGAGASEGRASFRDMAAFNFLPQHIVANPYTMFFKADTYEHQEKLRIVFPLVLGAVDNHALSLRRQAKDLERNLDRKNRQQEAAQRALDLWATELRTTYLQAKELGFLQDGPDPEVDWPINRYVDLLAGVPQSANERLPELPAGATARTVSELSRLRDEEAQSARRISSIKRRLIQIDKLSQATDAYGSTLRAVQPRVRGVGWFAERIKESRESCPICGSDSGDARRQIDQLLRVSSEIQTATEAVVEARPVYDDEINALRQELESAEERINELRGALRQLEGESRDLEDVRQTVRAVYRFVGRVEQALRNFEAASATGGLGEEILALREKLQLVRDALTASSSRVSQANQLQRVSHLISPYARSIGVEWPDAPIELDIPNLTVRVVLGPQRKDFLWEIGSGANWMGYHIATFLALHEFFLGLPGNPVPSFLVIDQPSQVFFPEHAILGRSRREKISEVLNEADVVAARRIFETLSLGWQRTGGGVQLFVIDHAGEDVWRNIDGIHRVARWREGEALIPADW